MPIHVFFYLQVHFFNVHANLTLLNGQYSLRFYRILKGMRKIILSLIFENLSKYIIKQLIHWCVTIRLI